MIPQGVIGLILQLGAVGGLIVVSYVAIMGLIGRRRDRNGGDRRRSSDDNPVMKQLDCLKQQQDFSDTIDKKLDGWGKSQKQALSDTGDRIVREVRQTVREHELQWHPDEVSSRRKNPLI